MGQIVRRRKKGRPPKSDPPRRARSPEPASERSVRRSLRRRNVRYSNFVDYDDFIEDEEEEDEEDEEEDEVVTRRREKKVKLVVKLSQKARGGHGSDSGGSESGEEGDEAAAGAEAGSEEEEEEEESERKVVKKRRISGREEEDDLDDDVDDDYGVPAEEDSGRKGNSKGHESPPGKTSGSLSKVPLPDKKTLELILDKLQKKDIYGVYAEPVDPEELPDYHDVIENPMDFSTVRKKLANGSYATLNQFESDVFLICTNAMQYNAPDTIYHKQARTIQELGRKKLLKLRIKYERSLEETKSEHKVVIDHESSERDLKSDQGPKSSLSVKKLMKKPLSRSAQEPVSSDFSGGAMLATPGDLHCGSTANQGGCNERHSFNDGLTDGYTASAENFADKAEEVYMGRGFSSKLGRKPSVHDENRRATYTMPIHPAVRSHSIFTTFEGEIRQLVAVGLQAEYAYARSLARFASSLGPVAWKVASQRIEESLPSGCKYGRGWVVEYEPLPTPIIFTQKSTCQDSSMLKTLSHDVQPKREGMPFKILPSAKEDAFPSSAQEARQSTISHGKSMASLSYPTMKSHQISSTGLSNRGLPEAKAIKQFELNSLPSVHHNNGDATHVLEEKISDNSGVAASRSRETTPASSNYPQTLALESVVSRSKETASRSVNTRQTMPFAQFDGSGNTRKMPNGKVPKNGFNSSKMISPCTGVANKMPVPPSYFAQQDQGLSDPVQLMRMLNEKAQRQQTSSNHADSPRGMQAIPSVVRDASGNIASVGSWMTIGAGGIKQSMQNSGAQKIQLLSQLPYHVTQQTAGVQGSEFPVSSGIQFQAEKNGLPLRGFVQNPAFPFNEAQFRPHQILLPQSISADFSRFQPQSHWRGVTPTPPTQQRLKQDALPPDLNIGFQSPPSPVRQSSSVLVDSQQPDLALQL